MTFRLATRWSRGPATRPMSSARRPPPLPPVSGGVRGPGGPGRPGAGRGPGRPGRPGRGRPLVITGVNLTNFQIVNNVLTATGTVTGTLAGLPFTTQITNFALQLVPDNPATPAVECSVLHLELAPIHLSLLGLHVDTSPICLDITATEGGGLLGDLLCGLAGGGLLGTGIPTSRRAAS